MQKVVTDFDLTVLWPLIIFTSFLLWHSIQRRIAAGRSNRIVERDFERQIRLGAVGEEAIEERYQSRRSKVIAGRILWAVAIVFVALIAVLPASGKLKLEIGYRVWELLALAGLITLLVTVWVAWQCARDADVDKLALCLLIILLAAASTVHFFHQEINALRFVCRPHCNVDDDDDRPDNSSDF